LLPTLGLGGNRKIGAIKICLMGMSMKMKGVRILREKEVSYKRKAVGGLGMKSIWSL